MAVRKKMLFQLCGISALAVAVPMAGLSLAQQPEPSRATTGKAAAPAAEIPATAVAAPASFQPPAGQSAQVIQSTGQVSFGSAAQMPVASPVFQIPANTPTKDLLPRAPQVAKIRGPVLADDLSQIPEIAFEAKTEKGQGNSPEPLTSQAAYQLAKINHLNAKKTDGFMRALIESRADLAGVPFRMGDECRTTGAQVQHFNQAAETVRRALGNQGLGQAQVFTQPMAAPQVVLPPTNATVAPVTALADAVPPSPGPVTASSGTPAASAPPIAPAPPALPGTPAPTAPATPTTGAPTPPVAGPAIADNISPNFTSATAQLAQQVQQFQVALVTSAPASAAAFWQSYSFQCDQEDAARGRKGHDPATVEMVRLARIAALTQILAAESADIRLGLVKYLGGVPHVEATKALARMVLFSPEEDVRSAAIAALKVRREKDYTDVLVKGLRYPWPAVAKRAADAIAKLERTDLVPELLAVLEGDDPRLPAQAEENGKVVVREMVKLNHHRNCMLCHPPSGSGAPNPTALLAEVAVQDQPLPSPSEGYRQNRQELLIRIDATYLRPDFSASMQVKDAHPWPEMQRFDFLVRERKLTKEEAVAYREQLKLKEPGVISPYHKGAVAALRDLTGKDAAPTAEAWRKLLDRSVAN